MVFLDPHDRFRLERGSEHLYRLGARAVAEFLADGDDLASLLARLQCYQQCAPALLYTAGGDRFPPQLTVVGR
jgi:hypothetical protein